MAVVVLVLLLVLALAGDVVQTVRRREAARDADGLRRWILDHPHSVEVVVRPDASDDDYARALRALAALRGRPA